MCVFTTHTPVPAAHDQFSPDLAERILSRSPMSQLMHRCCYGGALNMTYLALNFSHYVNGVPCAAAKSRARCLEGYDIDAITLVRVLQRPATVLAPARRGENVLPA